jgi:predicted permease
MLSMPLLHATILGLLLNLGDLTVPEPLAKAIHLIGQAAVPAMLLVLGVRLAETFQNRQRMVRLPALGAVTVLRLIVAPALAWLFAGLVGLNGLARNVSVLETAMPTAVMTTILATEFDSDAPFAALCVVVTTLVSLPTVAILLNLLP